MAMDTIVQRSGTGKIQPEQSLAQVLAIGFAYCKTDGQRAGSGIQPRAKDPLQILHGTNDRDRVERRIGFIAEA